MDCPVCLYPIAGKVSLPTFDSEALITRKYTCQCGATLEISIVTLTGAREGWNGKRNISKAKVTYCAGGCGARLAEERKSEYCDACLVLNPETTAATVLNPIQRCLSISPENVQCGLPSGHTGQHSTSSKIVRGWGL